MASIMVQMFKYLILFCFIGYIFGCFYVYRKGTTEKQKKNTYIVQKVLLYCIHAFGFFTLYLHNPDIKLIGFYLMQVVLITAIFIFYHIIYKWCLELLVNNMCMLLVISLIMLTRLSFAQAFRQFVFMVAGAVGMLIIPLLLQKASRFRKYPAIYFVVGVLLLFMVVIIGSTSYGAKLTISIAGISFQPSEFVKIIFVFFVAGMLFKERSIKKVLLTSILSAIFVLLLVASRDLGGALLYFVAFLMILYVATRRKIVLIGGGAGVAIAAVAGYVLFSHVQTRVYAWLNPLGDVNDRGYQICQSLFGIGTGGWFGFGIGEGLPSKIPVVDKDFIFSAISEEFGGIFAICLILLCVSCFMLIVNVATRMTDNFYRLVLIGLGTLYIAQVILTIGGAIKFIPSTGVTLPLVSYGGSSLLSSFCMFGIVQGLYMRHASHTEEKEKKVKARQDKEHLTVFYIFGVICLAMIGYFTYFMTFESEKFINNSYNGLQVLFEEDVKKGDILTSDGHVIAETITTEDGTQERNYPYKNMFAHVAGYSANGRTGLEKQLNFQLLRSHAFFVEQLMCDITGEKKDGDNVITTLDYDMQKLAYEALGKNDGAVIVMEPSTGNILAMVSKPDYDPNKVLEDWEDINKGSALYNRATQGQYTPGSVFKILTTLAFMRSNPEDYAEYSYTCNGEITIDGKTIHCASNKKHGEVDLEEAFAKSCNTAFVNMVSKIDADIFQSLCDELLFNQSLPIAFESSKSKFSYLESDESALKQDTLIGQGKTLCSPLHMAMLVSAVCNDGVAMRPNMFAYSENNAGILVEKNKSKQYKTLFTEEEVRVLSQYMKATVEDGTASKLSSKKYEAFGKTGTAQTSSDLDKTNAWFAGYAKADGREVAVVVVVEDAGSGSKHAVPIAKELFDLYFE